MAWPALRALPLRPCLSVYSSIIRLSVCLFVLICLACSALTPCLSVCPSVCSSHHAHQIRLCMASAVWPPRSSSRPDGQSYASIRPPSVLNPPFAANPFPQLPIQALPAGSRRPLLPLDRQPIRSLCRRGRRRRGATGRPLDQRSFWCAGRVWAARRAGSSLSSRPHTGVAPAATRRAGRAGAVGGGGLPAPSAPACRRSCRKRQRGASRC
jgi:hypothetical protein